MSILSSSLCLEIQSVISLAAVFWQHKSYNAPLAYVMRSNPLVYIWCFYIMWVWTRAEYRPDRLNIIVMQRQKRAANRSHFSMMLQSAGDGRVSVGRERWSGCGKRERERANEGGNELERIKEWRVVFKSRCQIWCLENRMGDLMIPFVNRPINLWYFWLNTALNN